MAYTDSLAPEARRLDAAKILDVINSEISFYRTRQMSIYYLAMLSQVLVVTGDKAVKGLPRDLAKITYGVFFVGVAVFAVLLGYSYARRIWDLRIRRAELLEACSLAPSPLPRHEPSAVDSPSWWYAVLIVLLSVVGAALTIAGGVPQP
jgi:hypothetical protein